MFAYPATELFNAEGETRVVWSIEEYEAALAEGWSHEKPAPAEDLSDLNNRAPKKSARK